MPFVSRRRRDRPYDGASPVGGPDIPPPLAIGLSSVQGAVMSNQAPPHSFEIIFYSTASLLMVIGLTWYFVR
jgi:hypothetical protein